MYTGYPSSNLVLPIGTQRVWRDCQFSVSAEVFYGAQEAIYMSVGCDE